VSTRANGGGVALQKNVIGRTLTAIALLGAVAGIVLMAANVSQDLYEHSSGRPLAQRIWLVDVDAEDSIYTWLSLVVLFAVAMAMGLIANLRAMTGRSDGLQWGILAFGFAGLSLDEAVGLHEKLSDTIVGSLHLAGIWSYGWVVPALVIAVTALLLFVPFLRRLPFNIAHGLVIAGILFVGGAVGMEMLSGLIVGAPDQMSLTYRSLVAIEEALELAGALLCLYIIGSNVPALSDY